MSSSRIKAFISISFASLYLLNPGWGVFELIPDNIPFFGNLDEGAATMLLLWGIKALKNNSQKVEK